MKALVVSGLIGAALGGAVVQPSAVTDFIVNPAGIMDLYLRVFPGDPLKQAALDLCFRQDHGFNRLDTAERDSCYARYLPRQQAAAPAANFVDLWQAAGRGHTPKDDIRAQQQAAQVVHPAAARLSP